MEPYYQYKHSQIEKVDAERPKLCLPPPRISVLASICLRLRAAPGSRHTITGFICVKAQIKSGGRI